MEKMTSVLGYRLIPSLSYRQILLTGPLGHTVGLKKLCNPKFIGIIINDTDFLDPKFFQIKNYLKSKFLWTNIWTPITNRQSHMLVVLCALLPNNKEWPMHWFVLWSYSQLKTNNLFCPIQYDLQNYFVFFILFYRSLLLKILLRIH